MVYNDSRKFGKYGLRSSLGQWRDLDCLRRSFIASSIRHLSGIQIAAKYRVLAAGCLLICQCSPLPTDLRNRRNQPGGGDSSSPAGKARYRHSFREFLHRGGRRARTTRTGGERQGRGSEVAGGPSCSTPTSRRPTRCPSLGPPPPEIDFGRPSGAAPRGTRRARPQSNVLSTSGSRSRLGRHKHRVNLST